MSAVTGRILISAAAVLAAPFTTVPFTTVRLATVPLARASEDGAGSAVRALILTGANNHDWRSTTPEIRAALESSPRFSVAGVLEDPSTLTEATLLGCDVVVSNWSAWPELTGRQWGKASEDAFVAFIRRGGGLVTVHAACATSHDWPELQELVGLTWSLGTTAHGAYHTFPVTFRDRDHPITRGLPDFWITDELWHAMGSLATTRPAVLATAWSAADQGGTGQDEPVLVTTTLGEGRGVNIVLGHDAAAMRNLGWRTLLLRSAEWAATGAVTQPAPAVWPVTELGAGVRDIDPGVALRGVLAWRHGASRRPLNDLAELVRWSLAADAALPPVDGTSRAGALAARLAASVSGGAASVEARTFLLGQLSLVGREAEVPALAPLLLDASLSHPARIALERIPGARATEALRVALPEARGALRAGIATSLGVRRDAEGVPALARLLADGAADPIAGDAAAWALGRIGNEAAARALLAALGAAAGEMASGEMRRRTVPLALLEGAERLAAAGKGELAAEILERLRGPSELAEVRAAALRGLARTRGDEGVRLLVEAILGDPVRGEAIGGDAASGRDPDFRRAAIAVGHETWIEGRVLAALREASASDGRVLAMLADWPDPQLLAHLVAMAVVASESAGARPGPTPAAGAPGIAGRPSDWPPEVRIRFALSGVARLGSVPSPDPEGTAALVARALELAEGRPEAEALLAALASQPSRCSLGEAVDRLEDPALSAAAARAVVAVARALPRTAATKDELVAALGAVLRAEPAAPEPKQAASAILRELLRPANLALGATASSPDGLEPDGASGNDQAAIDGNPDTYWDEADDQPLYRFVVTFPEPVEVASILLKGHAYRSHSPRDFDVLLDDRVVKEVRDAQYDPATNEVSVSFPKARCRALELRMTRSWPRSPGIRELEVYGVPFEEVVAAAGPAYSWKRADSSLDLEWNGRTIWALRFPGDGRKPWFDHVALPEDGTSLTWPSPPDHPWHRGLWFAWKQLDGVNYWEEDAATGLSEGLTRVTGSKVETSPDGSARVELSIEYAPPGKPAVLTEARTLEMRAPDAGGRWRIDWRSAFRAGPRDVELRGGTAGGGYAGLSVRVSQGARDWTLLRGRGPDPGDASGPDPSPHGRRASWMDFSFECRGRPAGIAILDHPENLRFPSHWHVVAEPTGPFGYFSPAPLWKEPHTLAAGAELVLRYRIVVHPGRGDAFRLDREWKRFAAVGRSGGTPRE